MYMIGKYLLGAALALAVFAPCLQAGYVDEVLADSPVAYWRLNEKSDTDPIVDLTGNVANGNWDDRGGMDWGAGGAIVGDPDTAVQFATAFGFGCGGACGVGQVPAGGVLDLGTVDSQQVITLEAWFKLLPSVNDALPPSAFPRIFHYNNFDAGQYAFGLVGNDSGGFPGQRTVWAGRGDGSDSGFVILAAEADAIPPSDDEEWFHFVAQLQEDEVRLFLNGEELSDLTDSDPIFWQAEQATIGGRIQSDGSTVVQSFPGLIDELAIYNTLLSPERIQAHYQAGLGLAVTGDFNNNGVLDAPDIDDLTMQSAGGQNPPAYDLNADNAVNATDVTVWVKQLFGTWIGDANLDKEFNSSDLVQVLASGLYEVDSDSKWSTGDFNGDGRSNSGDLVAALADGGYEVGAPPALAGVPEPASWTLLAIAGLMWTLGRRR
jgi:hypothetical protein